MTTINYGDRVCYTQAFLQSTGQYFTDDDGVAFVGYVDGLSQPSPTSTITIAHVTDEVTGLTRSILTKNLERTND